MLSVRAVLAVVAAGGILLSARISEASTFAIEADQSRVRFEVSHMDYVQPVRGRFVRLEGEIDYDAASPRNLAVDVRIDASSIDTSNRYRDGHLRSSFFETDKYPEIRFRVIRVLLEDQAVEGELTIKGHSEKVILQVSNVRELVDGQGGRVLRCRAKGRINRRDFGVEENADATSGLEGIVDQIQEGLDKFIEDDVEIDIFVVAREVPEAPAMDDLAGLE